MSADKTLELIERLLPLALGTINVGLEVANKISAALSKARAESRQVSDAELKEIEATTVTLRDQVMDQLEQLKNA